MKDYCGGDVIYRREEGIWYCQSCGEIFSLLEDVNTSNQAHENYEVDENGLEE
jgi:ribosomal protein L37AE/L43A